MKTLPYTQEQLSKLLAGETVVRRFPVKPSEMHHDYTGDGNPFPDKSQCPYQKGQRLKVGEEWQLEYMNHRVCCDLKDLYDYTVMYRDNKRKFVEGYVVSVEYLHRSDWQPAETLPLEFARYEVEVVGEDCKQLGKLTEDDWRNMGFDLSYCLKDSIKERGLANAASKYVDHLRDFWNKNNPDNLYCYGKWTFGIETKLVTKGE